MKKIKGFIINILVLCIVLFAIMVSISSFRSTNENYVCSGELIEKEKSPRHVNLKFEIKNDYSGIPWDNSYWTFVRIDSFYASEFDGLKNYGSIRWTKTIYGKNLMIFAENNDTLVSFDFNSKILDMGVYNARGTLERNYNLLCNKI